MGSQLRAFCAASAPLRRPAARPHRPRFSSTALGRLGIAGPRRPWGSRSGFRTSISTGAHAATLRAGAAAPLAPGRRFQRGERAVLGLTALAPRRRPPCQENPGGPEQGNPFWRLPVPAGHAVHGHPVRARVQLVSHRSARHQGRHRREHGRDDADQLQHHPAPPPVRVHQPGRRGLDGRAPREPDHGHPQVRGRPQPEQDPRGPVQHRRASLRGHGGRRARRRHRGGRGHRRGGH